MSKEEQEFYSKLEVNTLEQNVELRTQTKEGLEEMNKQLRAKKYAVSYKQADLKDLAAYLATEVTFKGGESLGLVQLSDEIKKLKVDNGVVLVDGIVVEAAYFFLSRHEGKSLDAAKRHQSVFKPLTTTYENIRQDGQEFKKLADKLSALEQHIAFQEEAEAAATAAQAMQVPVENDAASTVE